MVVDRSALIAILLGEPEGDALAVALAGAEMPVICAPNWLEAMMVISARLGRPGVQALSDLLDAAEVQVEPADAELVQTAFDAWQRFGKGRHPAGLNFGDCFAYALTSRRGDVLLFKKLGGRDPSTVSTTSASHSGACRGSGNVRPAACRAGAVAPRLAALAGSRVTPAWRPSATDGASPRAAGCAATLCPQGAGGRSRAHPGQGRVTRKRGRK